MHFRSFSRTSYLNNVDSENKQLTLFKKTLTMFSLTEFDQENSDSVNAALPIRSSKQPDLVH